MSVTQITSGVIYGIEKINIKVINGQFEVQESIWLEGISKLPINNIVEQGERVVDKADGVGVIGIHEEDNTLLGADISVEHGALSVPVLYAVLGGRIEADQYGNIISYDMPTIQQQRENPKRFILDAYARCSDFGSGGYIMHRFHYCKGMAPGFGYADAQFSTQGLTIKARPRPDNGQTHSISFMDTIPD